MHFEVPGSASCGRKDGSLKTLSFAFTLCRSLSTVTCKLKHKRWDILSKSCCFHKNLTGVDAAPACDVLIVWNLTGLLPRTLHRFTKTGWTRHPLWCHQLWIWPADNTFFELFVKYCVGEGLIHSCCKGTPFTLTTTTSIADWNVCFLMALFGL